MEDSRSFWQIIVSEWHWLLGAAVISIPSGVLPPLALSLPPVLGLLTYSAPIVFYVCLLRMYGPGFVVEGLVIITIISVLSLFLVPLIA